MTDNATKSEDSRLDHAHYVELSELELSCIVHIVAPWGRPCRLLPIRRLVVT